MILTIGNKEDRRTIAGILTENGYTVRIIKTKVKNTTRLVLEAEKEEKEKEV